MNPKPHKKYYALESLRGIAAISVVFGHFKIGGHLPYGFINNSHLMVDFFFVLSGFVVSLSNRNRLTNGFNILRFQIDRFMRLYPLHILMLVIFLIIEVLKYLVLRYFKIAPNQAVFEFNNYFSFIANIFLVQSWTFSGTSWNQPSWSISAEFYTYFIYAAIASAANRSKIKYLFLCCVFCFISFSFLLKTGLHGVNNLSGPLRCMYSFFIGVMVQYVFEVINLKWDIKNSYLSVGLIFLSFIAVTFVDLLGSFQLLIPWLFGGVILFLVSTKESAFIVNVLSSRILVYIGSISYGIYMIHGAVWWLVAQVLRFVFKVKTKINEYGYVVVDVNSLTADLILVVGLTIIILFADLSKRYIEDRFRYSGDRLLVWFQEARKHLIKL